MLCVQFFLCAPCRLAPVCLYLYIHMNIVTCTSIPVCRQHRVDWHLCVYVYMYTYIYIHMYMCVLIYVGMYLCIYVHIYVSVLPTATSEAVTTVL